MHVILTSRHYGFPLQGFVEISPKPVLAKVHGSVLVAVAKGTNDPVPEVREAMLQVLCMFVLGAGSRAPIDKVCFSQCMSPHVRGYASAV